MSSRLADRLQVPPHPSSRRTSAPGGGYRREPGFRDDVRQPRRGSGVTPITSNKTVYPRCGPRPCRFAAGARTARPDQRSGPGGRTWDGATRSAASNPRSRPRHGFPWRANVHTGNPGDALSFTHGGVNPVPFFGPLRGALWMRSPADRCTGPSRLNLTSSGVPDRSAQEIKSTDSVAINPACRESAALGGVRMSRSSCDPDRGEWDAGQPTKPSRQHCGGSSPGGGWNG